MLNTKVESKFMKGQLAGNVIAYAIAIIIVVALIPGVQTAITSAGLTGAPATLASLIVLIMVVILLYAGMRLAGLA